MDLTKYSKGKRMVREDKIKQIDELKAAQDQAAADIEELKEDVAAIPVVAANPTLEGTEPELEGLEVGGTKYAMPSGGTVLYKHVIEYNLANRFSDTTVQWYAKGTITVNSNQPTAFTILDLLENGIIKQLFSNAIFINQAAGSTDSFIGRVEVVNYTQTEITTISKGFKNFNSTFGFVTENTYSYISTSSITDTVTML